MNDVEKGCSIYETQLKIKSLDVDMSRKLRLSKLFAMAQEAAIEHSEELGAGRDKTMDRGLLWVVTLQYAEIYRMPVYQEKVTLRTWPGKPMHLVFPRFFTVLDESGEALVKISAMWSLIDSNTRSIVFPEKYGINIEGTVTGDEIALPSAPKNIECSENMLFRVPSSFTDLNGHMNNTRYFDLAEDCLFGSTRGKELRRVRSEYSREIRLGDEVRISWGSEGNEYFVRGDKEKKAFRIGLSFE